MGIRGRTSRPFRSDYLDTQKKFEQAMNNVEQDLDSLVLFLEDQKANPERYLTQIQNDSVFSLAEVEALAHTWEAYGEECITAIKTLTKVCDAITIHKIGTSKYQSI